MNKGDGTIYIFYEFRNIKEKFVNYVALLLYESGIMFEYNMVVYFYEIRRMKL